MRAIDQNITTFFAAILNTEKALGTKLTTQTVTHSMREVSRIKFPRKIAQSDYYFYGLLFDANFTMEELPQKSGDYSRERYYSRKYDSPTRYKWSYMYISCLN